MIRLAPPSSISRRLGFGVSPEFELLLCALSAGTEPRAREQIADLLARAFHWPEALRLARQHRITSLLREGLKRAPAGAVPAEVRQRLDHARHVTLSKSLRLTALLTNILARLDDARIPAIPFKGPTLAAMAYGDLGLREFLDLDILVGRHDVARAGSVLGTLGFHARFTPAKAQEDEFLAAENASTFRREVDGSLVEVHWSLTPKYLPFYRDSSRLWDRLERVSPGGQPFSTIAREHLLLFLCVHGTKHCWERLAWVCDIARMVDGHAPLNWTDLLNDANEGGSRRMLLLGLLLARDLLHATLPDTINRLIADDPTVGELGLDVQQHLAVGARPFMSNTARMRVHWKTRERFRDRARYGFHVALTPSVRDYEAVRLPRYLSFLYQPMRPFRLLWEYNGQGRRS